MHLHLKYPLEPGSAPRHAAAVVEAALDISGAELDYSAGSIDLVEDIVDSFRSDGATCDEMAESLAEFGCYVGEILVRHAGGAWRHAPAGHHPVPLVVELPGPRLCHPVDWVFQRLEHGPDVSISALYATAVHDGAPDA
ncbi:MULTISPECIES: hypothetical protein [unclassified Streptomyces]|uniref:hypothetical protein n=1 Tax=unclassified Streptomyces TaxID=2593676 RepID=UPI000DBA6470|nr:MULTISPECIES: hypothetical protein [unclassified Streptomyces]MYT69075.1 hypothetical protein [Streptomyces sp. SID8367]RAJ82586.1 hypothetical protein K377_04306 [Streptomyces sp. PsTaAH-137]